MKQILINLRGKILRNILGVVIVKLKPKFSTKYAKKHFKGKEIVVVEIGTNRGHNISSLFKELNIKKLYIIDPYDSYDGYLKSEPYRTQNNLNKDYEICKKRLKKYEDRIVFIRKYSDDAINDIPQADYIYIDGNHDYEYVIKDIRNYFPKVKEGGVLGGDDLNIKGVSKAIIEFCYENKITPNLNDNEWVIEKEVRE